MVRKHKPCTGLKVYSTIVSLLLIVAIILTGCAFGLGWVQLAENVDQVQGNEEQSDGGLVVNEGEEDGIALTMTKLLADDYEVYGISPLAETAYTLTATITPSYAADQTVDWTVAWANSSSTWASGKTVTDYVTVTPTEDGALTATAVCLQDFGEQIIITVTSRDNAAASATCTADYEKKLSTVSMSVNSQLFNFNIGSNLLATDDYNISGNVTDTFSFNSVTTTYSNYTIDVTYTITTQLTTNAAAVTQLNQYYGSYGSTFYAIPVTLTAGSSYSFLSCIGTEEGTSPVEEGTTEYEELIIFMGNEYTTNMFYIQTLITGGSSTQTCTLAIYFAPDSLLSVTDVDLTPGTIVF